MREPIVGEDIYVGTSMHIDRGQDDFHGGLCRITEVTRHPEYGPLNSIFVSVAEKRVPLNWLHLLENQERWRQEFGQQRGYPDPCP